MEPEYLTVVQFLYTSQYCRINIRNVTLETEKSSRLLGIIFLKFYKIHFQLLASNEVAESFAQFFNAASFKMNNKLDHMTRAIQMEADM